MRKIPGYSDYMVDQDGMVYGKRFGTPMVPSGKRYKMVNLTSDTGDVKSIKVHRAVAAAFLGLDLSNSRIEVNHKDGDKFNNRVSNLELVTRSENCVHRAAMNFPMDSEEKKECRSCRELKLKSEFGHKHDTIDNLSSYCKSCANAKARERYAKEK